MGRRFAQERRRDPYYRAAQSEGLRSRAAFKLAYLIDRFPILRAGDRVLDLGASPGGWSVVVREALRRSGEVVAVDPREFVPYPGVRFVAGRVGDPRLIDRLGPDPFDLVLSDMSPRISGAYSADHARSVELVRAAFELAQGLLADDGRFVAKVFAGDLLDDLAAEISPSFRVFRRTKPPASRERSSEIYLIGIGFQRARSPMAPDPGGPDDPGRSPLAVSKGAGAETAGRRAIARSEGTGHRDRTRSVRPG